MNLTLRPTDWIRMVSLLPRFLGLRGTILVFLTCLTILCVFTRPVCSAADGVTLDPSQGRISLTPYMDVLEDPDQKLTITDVTSSNMTNLFTPVGAQTFSAGISSSAYWFRFTLDQAVTQTDTLQAVRDTGWILDTGRPFFSSATLYVPNKQSPGGWSVVSTGDPLRLPKGTPYNTLPVFSLPNVIASPITCYLRVESISSMLLPIEVCSMKAYTDRSQLQMLCYGLYFGVILALVFYNLFLFVSLRDVSYFWYVLYIMCFALYFAGINGLALKYIHTIPIDRFTRFGLWALGCALLGVCFFTRSFLMTRRQLPVLDKVLKILMWMAVLLVVLTGFLDIRFLSSCYAVIGIVAPVVIIGTGMACWDLGFHPARYFVMAWAIFAVSGMSYALTYSGLVPYFPWVYHSFQAGSALEAILLSLALADRIKSIQREREEARRNEQRYMTLAVTDGLTGMYNSSFFRSRLQQEIKQAEAHGRALTMLMLDVDNFKQYNDTHGHLDGDSVLIRLGQVIRASVRGNDIPCRYGGEEFAVVLPGTSLSGATEVAERIREAFGREVFTTSGGNIVRVTVSIGIATYEAGMSATVLITRADTMLYQAKAQGKNCVIAWPGNDVLDNDDSMLESDNTPTNV